MSVSNWRPDTDVLTCLVLSKRLAKPSVHTNVYLSIRSANAGPPKLTTASEVATMEFARTILNIPVPQVLAWRATDQNPVQAEYIIMEEASGSQLHEVWQDLPLRKKVDIIREFVDIERKLLSISFHK
jgi:hypothetical protein